MRDWLASLTSERVPEVVIALALGYALASLADQVARVPVAVLATHVGRVPDAEDDGVLGLVDLFSGPHFLYFDVGGTRIVYGLVLSQLLVLGLVGLATWLVVRRRDRALGECPFCASRIPHESTHCAYCGSGVAPGDPEPE
jgi:hypothetical protein